MGRQIHRVGTVPGITGGREIDRGFSDSHESGHPDFRIGGLLCEADSRYQKASEDLRPGTDAQIDRIEYIELSGFFTYTMKVVNILYSICLDYLSIVNHYIDFKGIIYAGMKFSCN